MEPFLGLSFKILVANKYKMQKAADKLKSSADQNGSDISLQTRFVNAEVQIIYVYILTNSYIKCICL